MAAGHAAEQVVFHSDHLALGVHLGDEFAEGVVFVFPVFPVAHVGIGHAALAAADVVSERGDVGFGVDSLGEVAEGAVSADRGDRFQ